MLLITTTHQPASDLGYLLHKNPNRNFSEELSFGTAHVVYPEVTEERATAAVLLEIDPIKLVRGSGEAKGSLSQYVNDRPYVASSFLSVAINAVFSTALSGRSKERPELAETPIPLEVRIPVIACRAGAERIQMLFVPLGYQVEATRIPLDENFPSWGESPFFDLTLRGTVLLRDLLRHLYLLLPVLDSKKHYYMDGGEVQKLISKGEGWLPNHPEKNWIVRASLGRKPSFMRAALEQLSNVEEELERQEQEVDEVFAEPDVLAERAPSLHDLRHLRVAEIVKDLKPKSLVDLGCGEGRLLRRLIPIQGLDRIVGMDVSYYELEKAQRKLHLDEASPRMRERVELIHGSLLYRDERLKGFDVCTVVEVIEHLDLARLNSFERIVFGYCVPKNVIVTTPNREYNAEYEVEGFRHTDHRFEWDRAEFEAWTSRIASTYGYQVRCEGVGAAHERLGHPGQLAVFSR